MSASIGDDGVMTDHELLAFQVRQGEAAYDRMYDARRPAGEFSDCKDAFAATIAIATRLGLTERAAELEARLAHIKSVFRSQFG